MAIIISVISIASESIKVPYYQHVLGHTWKSINARVVVVVVMLLCSEKILYEQ